MPTVEASVAAATAVVDYDVFTGVAQAIISRGQRVTGVAVKGSAAAGDTIIQVETSFGPIARLYNNNTGFPGRDDVLPVDYVHNGEQSRIYAKVVDAPATNPINVLVVISARR